MTDKIKNIIDFHGATHGHFLEYVINSWIYNGHRVDRIFTDLGTSHNPRSVTEYQNSCMIKCNHFTEFTEKIHYTSRPEKIIRITVNTPVGKWIHMINVMYRVGDVTLPNSYKLIPDKILNSPAKLRMNWFSKFVDDENSYRLDYPWRWPDVNGFYFPMENFYDLSVFYQTLHQCAAYLEHKFIPDNELYIVWKEFIQLNQGVQIYNKSKQIVELALGQEYHEFHSTEPEQALINVILSTIIGLHDGPLFSNNTYATNTIEVWKFVKEHLDNFDKRF